MNLGLGELAVIAFAGGIVGLIVGSVRGHSNGLGFWLGFLLGPLGWLLLLVMTPQKKAEVAPTAAPLAPAPPNTPEGWHPDPSGRFQHRYWSGTRWTEHVHNGTSQHVDPV